MPYVEHGCIIEHGQSNRHISYIKDASTTLSKLLSLELFIYLRNVKNIC